MTNSSYREQNNIPLKRTLKSLEKVRNSSYLTLLLLYRYPQKSPSSWSSIFSTVARSSQIKYSSTENPPVAANLLKSVRKWRKPITVQGEVVSLKRQQMKAGFSFGDVTAQ